MKLNTQTKTFIELTEAELYEAISKYLKEYKSVTLPRGEFAFNKIENYVRSDPYAGPLLEITISQK